MGICHDHGKSTFAHNGYFLFCISARVEKVCFTTHSPATLEALLIWFSDKCCPFAPQLDSNKGHIQWAPAWMILDGT
jgi:hypothetical protein